MTEVVAPHATTAIGGGLKRVEGGGLGNGAADKVRVLCGKCGKGGESREIKHGSNGEFGGTKLSRSKSTIEKVTAAEAPFATS